MGNNGWIKVYRSITGWEWYTNIPVKTLFIHCLVKANHEPQKWQGIEILNGQFVSSIQNLAIDTGLTIQQVRTSLKKLKSTQEITYQTTSRYTIITVKNWDSYQPSNTKSNKQITNEQQTDNKQITTNKNKRSKESNLLHKLLKGNFEIKKEFIPLIEKWLDYKKSKNQAYKNEDSLKAFINKLLTLSGANLLKAEQIIDQSLANNWSGIFDIKNPNIKPKHTVIGGVNPNSSSCFDKEAWEKAKEEAAKNPVSEEKIKELGERLKRKCRGVESGTGN